MNADSQIAVAVDGWLDLAAPAGTSSSSLLASWEQVVVLLWNRVNLTLGEVTLAVIFERVVIEVSRRHPLAKGILVGDSGPDLSGLRADGATADAAAVRAGMRDFIVTYISLLDALTASVLTPALLAELQKVGRP